LIYPLVKVQKGEPAQRVWVYKTNSYSVDCFE